jgi:predicted DNA-binding transcriptional regulator YafY
VERLRRKLDRLYDLQILDNEEMQEQLAHNVSTLYEAIKRQVAVKLINYSSPHSNTTGDRIVEPFSLMNGNREVRCYELSSGINKTFKLSRMEDVELLDITWEHQDKHLKMFTDIFMFSGEKLWTVKLTMGRLAASVLVEEYPKAKKYIEKLDDTRWRLELPVCSFIGIGRFVMGLFEDIEVEECIEFKEFLKDKINKLNQKQL